MGSCNELEYQVRLAKDLDYLSDGDYEKLSRSIDEVGRMLTGFSARVMQRIEGCEERVKSSYLAPRT
jgi:four helix bundle protein